MRDELRCAVKKPGEQSVMTSGLRKMLTLPADKPASHDLVSRYVIYSSIKVLMYTCTIILKACLHDTFIVSQSGGWVNAPWYEEISFCSFLASDTSSVCMHGAGVLSNS